MENAYRRIAELEGKRAETDLNIGQYKHLSITKKLNYEKITRLYIFNFSFNFFLLI